MRAAPRFASRGGSILLYLLIYIHNDHRICEASIRGDAQGAGAWPHSRPYAETITHSTAYVNSDKGLDREDECL
jgi:hypothetical protein